MNTASELHTNRLFSDLDAKAETAMREFTMTNIERTFAEDNKQFWLDVATQFEARTLRLKKVSHNHLSYENERALMLFERASEIAKERSISGFGIYQLISKDMRPLKRFYQSLLLLVKNVSKNNVKMNTINSCVGLLCKMVYPHIDANDIETEKLIKKAVADINCSDTMEHEEKRIWLICTQRLNKKLSQTSGNLLNPPALKLV